MSEYQQRISDLLECCQTEWVTLETLAKENNATPSIHHANKELREGIKKLVQLQDNLDEIGNIVENNSEWNKKADLLMEDVRRRLQFASKLTSNVKPMVSQSSPLGFSTAHKYNYNRTTNNNSNTPNNNNTNNNISGIQEEREEDEEDSEEQFLDASEELPEQGIKDLILTNEPTSSSDIIKTKNSSASSLILLNNDEEEDIDKKPTFGRKSILLDELNKSEKKQKKLFPLFKGLRTSQSTPVNSPSPAPINFYKNDDNAVPDAKHFIFATDAIVDHPLRIGVGYGSYICYSCTILSDKGAPITVRKRYSDFVELREELVKNYPTLKRSIPKLPPKKVVGKFTPTFVEQRRKDLEYFFKYVVLHPTLGASPIVRHWIAP